MQYTRNLVNHPFTCISYHTCPAFQHLYFVNQEYQQVDNEGQKQRLNLRHAMMIVCMNDGDDE